ncbi:hypothetical protein [Methylorubrum extorquens]|uniref:hypothetical protein n=1 Tax=Methylorubrum extorquens TaxID=408 RepID=UPI00209F0CEE|nr:hypothetical protein [Methylorubrum extorquens]MCP1540103.1 hypothetical protein [Methylorubrum extorquens]
MQTLEDFRATSNHFNPADFETLTGSSVAGLVGSEAAPRAVPHLYARVSGAETFAVTVIEIDGRFEWCWGMGGVETSPSLAEAEADLFAMLTIND